MSSRTANAIPVERHLRVVRAGGPPATREAAKDAPGGEEFVAAAERAVSKFAAFFDGLLSASDGRLGRALDPGALAAQHRAPMEPTVTLDPATLKVWELARLQAGWDGRRAEPPSPLACESARRVIAQALLASAPPSRVVPDVEGGVAVYWFSDAKIEDDAPARRAAISIDNEGQMAASLKAGRDPLIAWDITLGAVRAELPRLLAFVKG